MTNPREMKRRMRNLSAVCSLTLEESLAPICPPMSTPGTVNMTRFHGIASIPTSATSTTAEVRTTTMTTKTEVPAATPIGRLHLPLRVETTVSPTPTLMSPVTNEPIPARIPPSYWLQTRYSWIFPSPSVIDLITPLEVSISLFLLMTKTYSERRIIPTAKPVVRTAELTERLRTVPIITEGTPIIRKYMAVLKSMSFFL